MNLHERALELAGNYRRLESELIDILIQIDDQKIFRTIGYSSLFVYCTGCLKLTESQSYTLINVARKSKEFPELKQAIVEQKISVSNAVRIAPALTQDNKDLWIEKAATLSKRNLEIELVKESPKPIPMERITPLTETRFELRIAISIETDQRIKRVKDLLSQKTAQSCDTERALHEALGEYIQRHDPVERAKRTVAKKTLQANQNKLANAATIKTSEQEALPKNTPKVIPRKIPAALKHQINLRDKGRCTHRDPKGQRCENSRWIELHHVQPYSLGGRHDRENLITLCHAHHRNVHEKNYA